MKPIDHVPLWDKAYAALRDAILAGRFGPGERLLLRELAAELNISLTPVRDAVNRLVAEHVLERGAPGQGGGALVPELLVDRFGQLLLIREDLEGRAAFHAAEKAGDQDLQALQSMLDDMLDLIARRKLDRYLGAHRLFHFRIYRIADMPILEQMIGNLWLRCSPALTYVVPTYVPLLRGTDFHRAALDAIRRRDPAAAAAAIRADIAEAGHYVLGLATEDGRIIAPPGARPPAQSPE